MVANRCCPDEYKIGCIYCNAKSYPWHYRDACVAITDTVGATRRVAPTGPASGSIGAIIGQFKSIVTKRINKMCNTRGISIWQRNYYEHIIRNENTLARIHEYIINNPAKWADDENNPLIFEKAGKDMSG